MFDELKNLIDESDIPHAVKISLLIISKAVSWMPWVFVIIGLMLDLKYFIYWLIFFIFIEGFLLVSLVYILIQITNFSLDTGKHKQRTKRSENSLLSKSVDGIIGNAAWYLLIIVALIFTKLTGVADNFINNVIDYLK